MQNQEQKIQNEPYPQVVSLSKPAAATHIKETAVLVRKALVSGNIVQALENLQLVFAVANQLKKAIVQEVASVAATSAKA
jgi:hypothetical protein